MRRKVRRKTSIGLAAKLPPCVVAMEARCGAHHLGRVSAAHGHDVRLMSPEYVRPYIKAHKNDDRDVEGIAEAATRPTMRFVELKSQDQLDMQTLHRSRDRFVGERTAHHSAARDLARARDGGAEGQAQARAIPHRSDGRARRSRIEPADIPLVADARTQGAELDRWTAAFDAEFVRWTRRTRTPAG
jgi:transposase